MFTVGARLRASASARKVETTLFTTTQAVGTELHLRRVERAPVGQGPEGRPRCARPGQLHRRRPPERHP